MTMPKALYKKRLIIEVIITKTRITWEQTGIIR